MFLQKNILTLLLYLTTLLIAIVVATTNYLPMLDLPQHAAQVQAFKSFLLNNHAERWFDTVEINYFTPYWVGYLSILFFSIFLPIQNAINLVVALSFVLFVYAFSSLRKRFSAPALLDWILIPCFFGFSYQFGLLTFTLSISIGILLLILTIQYIKIPSKKDAIYIILLGSALFFSHLLIFLFFSMISVGLILCYERKSLKQYFKLLIPFMILGVFIPLYFFVPSLLGQSNLDSYFNEATHSSFKYGSILERVDNLFIYQWALNEADYKPFGLTRTTFLILIFPFLLGYRLTKKPYKYIPLISFFIIWFSIPEHLFHTTFVYQRFSIFFIPFYILIFDCNTKENLTKQVFVKVRKWLTPIWLMIVIGLSILPVKDIIIFNTETKDFNTLLKQLPEKQLTMSLVYDGTGIDSSKGKRIAPVYIYFPVWYQVAKEGWVEYNFAWFSPQIVRYKSDKIPENRAGFAWNPWMFTQFKNCDYYDMIIVYSPNISFQEQFKQSTCSHIPYVQVGKWHTYIKNDKEFTK